MSPTEALRKIFDRPREVFIALRENRFWILAAIVLLAVLVAHIALISYSVFRAYAQYEPSEMEKQRYEALIEEYREEIEAAKEAARGEGATFVGSSGSGTSTTAVFAAGPGISVYHIGIGLVSLLIALVFEVIYFRVVGAFMELPYLARDWIAFSLWSRIPSAVLALVGVLLVILFTGYQANVTNYDVFSVARWIPLQDRPDRGINFFHIDIYHLDAALIWLIVLQTIGFQEWSRKSTITSLSVVAIPTVVLFGMVLWLSTDGLGWAMAFYY